MFVQYILSLSIHEFFREKRKQYVSSTENSEDQSPPKIQPLVKPFLGLQEQETACKIDTFIHKWTKILP